MGNLYKITKNIVG